jgi:hypothetical protein
MIWKARFAFALVLHCCCTECLHRMFIVHEMMQGFNHSFERQCRRIAESEWSNEEHWTVSTAAMYEELQNCKNEAGRHWDEATSLRNESRAEVGLLDAFQGLSEANRGDYRLPSSAFAWRGWKTPCQTTRDEKRTLEVNLGDAVAQMAQDCLRIEALEVNHPRSHWGQGVIYPVGTWWVHGGF